MLAAVLTLVFITVAVAAYALMTPLSVETVAVAERLRRVRNAAAPGPKAAAVVLDDEMAVPFTRRVLAPLLEALSRRLHRLTPGTVTERMRRRLVAAGLAPDPARFLVIKVLASTVLLLVGLLLQLGDGSGLFGVVVPPALALLGWQLPELRLSQLIERRRQAMTRALPDVLDLLVVSVEAGLGFDGAIQKVSEKFADPVAGEFKRYLKEVRLGRTRAEALRTLAERSSVPDLRVFVAAVIQADQLGVSMAKVLRAQSEAMRLRRRQRAEERAMQIPLKLIFPLVIFILPSLFVVILGPAVITAVQLFSGQ